MHPPRQWELVFHCPSCRKASRVNVAAMHALIRCPHCRKTAVISKRGIKATKRIARARIFPKSRFAGWWPPLALMAMLSLPILVLSLSLRPRSSGGSDLESQRLCDSARSFQVALLAADIPSAIVFLADEDKAKLPQWWAPQHAALTMSFGRAFQARVTEAEVIKKQGDRAVVRVRFRIGDREQQAFQHWMRADTDWVVILKAAGVDE